MKIHIDIETFSSVDLKKSGTYKYVESSDFEILLIAYALGSGPITVIDVANGEMKGHPGFLALLVNPQNLKCAHSATFERLALNKFFNLNLQITEFRCSMIKSAYCGLPLQLGAVSEALQLGDKGKLKTGTLLINFFCKPCKPTKTNEGRARNLRDHDLDKWQLFKEYVINDVEAEREIETILDPYEVPAHEWENYRLDQEINDRGIGIDVDFAENAKRFDDIRHGELMGEIKTRTGLDNPNSPAQLKQWLSIESGEEVTTLAKATIDPLIEKVESEAVKNVLRLRQKAAKTSTKKYVKMIDSVGSDGRGRGYFQFYGANRTGRWAGRFVQMQNLPQNHLKDLDVCRQIVAHGDYDIMGMSFEDISSTLSQLIRTAFVAKEGHVFVVADFAQIEARVLPWLAGAEWKLDIFREGKDIYKASASQMFGMAIEDVTKEDRQLGKISELALGFGGASGALAKMEKSVFGANHDPMSEGKKKDLVDRFRVKNPEIVAYWSRLDRAAKRTMETKRPVRVNNVIFMYDGLCLTIELPSGRKLFYYKPSFTANKFGGQSIRYMGMDQETKKWGYVETYGGKLTENCLSGNTKVLTLQGWKALKRVTLEDKIWDGFNWQKHEGLLNQGFKEVINLDGVHLTPDHKILTGNGWKNASQSEGFNRYEVKLPDSNKLRRIKREKIALESSLRLRNRKNNGSDRIQKRKSKILRLYEKRINRKCYKNSRLNRSPNLCSLAINESEMHKPKTQSFSQLWRQGYYSLPGMARQFRSLRERHAAHLRNGFGHRSDRQQRELRKSKLSLDYSKKEQPKQKEQHVYRHPKRENDNIRSFRSVRGGGNNYLLQSAEQMPDFKIIRQAGRKEQVYDLLNCGPLKRFTVLGENGPFIVHNCVQAIARDLLMFAMQNMDKEEYLIVMHVHDEAIAEVPENLGNSALERMCKIMSISPEWAKGLPLKAEGFISKYYKKD